MQQFRLNSNLTGPNTYFALLLMKVLLTICCFILSYCAGAQTCTTPGQNPSSAFPVCGTSAFKQTSVPQCGGRRLPSPCDRDQVTDINPFWYKFTCFEAGTLGFIITPDNLRSDYDWEIYDVTGRNAEDVYTDKSLVVASNWSGEEGETGTSASAREQFVCGGRGKPLYSRMPALIKGHNYLLLISHFTRTIDGYSIKFGGGTAVITDSLTPHLQKVTANCGGDVIRIKLNKKMKCNSLAQDGSDFFISASGIRVLSATGVGCSANFDTDSILVQLSAQLMPGKYVVGVKRGGDGNTLLDYCDNALPTTDVAEVVILPRQPTPMDSMATLSCAPQQVRLLFKKPMLCSSIAPNGSDFSIQGTYGVNILRAAGTCTDNTTSEVVVTLDRPLQREGSFRIVLQRGTDGNTLMDECSEETPAGSALSFGVKDTVNANFTYNITYGCITNVVAFTHPGTDGVNSWKWNLDERQQSSLQNPQANYKIFTPKNIRLAVTNGFCTDTASQTVVLDNYLKADFTVLPDNCPSETIPFTSTAVGKIVAHQWSFGDGGTSNIESPGHIYAPPVQQQAYTVRYTVTDSYGCQSTAQKSITVYSSCFIAVPTAFTPNSDGRNDYLHPLNALKAEKLEFKVFNRWGQLLFITNQWKTGWDGTFKNSPQPSGTYVWMLRYTDRDTKKWMEQKGTVVLIR